MTEEEIQEQTNLDDLDFGELLGLPTERPKAAPRPKGDGKPRQRVADALLIAALVEKPMTMKQVAEFLQIKGSPAANRVAAFVTGDEKGLLFTRFYNKQKIVFAAPDALARLPAFEKVPIKRTAKKVEEVAEEISE